jgi:hypothetical protein
MSEAHQRPFREEDKEKSLAPRLDARRQGLRDGFGLASWRADFNHSNRGFTADEYGQKSNENRSNHHVKFYIFKVCECIGLTREDSKPIYKLTSCEKRQGRIVIEA